jgi:hypothetical protein
MQYKSNVRSIEQPFDTSRGATMSTATITRVTPDPRRVSPQVRRPVRTGGSRGPVARPVRALPAPSVRIDRPADARACRVEAVSARGEWRLTDRGIAVVLLLVLMIAVAAVAVIGLTAWQVTGTDYAIWSAEVISAR